MLSFLLPWKPFLIGGALASVILGLVGYRMHVVSITRLEEQSRVQKIQLQQLQSTIKDYVETVNAYNLEREKDELELPQIPEFEGDGCHLDDGDIKRLQNN